MFKLDLLVTYITRITLTKVNFKKKNFTNVILRYKNLYITMYKLHCKSGVNVVLLLTNLLLFNIRLVFSYTLKTHTNCSTTSIGLLR